MLKARFRENLNAVIRGRRVRENKYSKESIHRNVCIIDERRNIAINSERTNLLDAGRGGGNGSSLRPLFKSDRIKIYLPVKFVIFTHISPRITAVYVARLIVRN